MGGKTPGICTCSMSPALTARTGKELAVKLERVDSKHPMLLYEAGTCPSLDADCGDASWNMLEAMAQTHRFILVLVGLS